MSPMTDSLQVSDEDRATLTAWSRSTAIRAGLVTRARIVLASAAGMAPARWPAGSGCPGRR